MRKFAYYDILLGVTFGYGENRVVPASFRIVPGSRELCIFVCISLSENAKVLVTFLLVMLIVNSLGMLAF